MSFPLTRCGKLFQHFHKLDSLVQTSYYFLWGGIEFHMIVNQPKWTFNYLVCSVELKNVHFKNI